MKTVELSDPGYGDASAPPGSEEWAKWWRLDFQSVIHSLPTYPEAARSSFESGQRHRAWVLLNKEDGSRFKTFQEFCEHKQPWGLGLPYDDLLGYLEARFGKQAVQLMTVPVDARCDNGKHPPEKKETLFDLHIRCANQHRNTSGKLRAILRAPEKIQELYRQGLVSQVVAAKMGPRSPTPEQAAKVAEARQAVETLPALPADAIPSERRRYRQQVDTQIRRVLGKPPPTPLEQVRKWFQKLSAKERRQFRQWLDSQT
jgi:hypothetical protein